MMPEKVYELAKKYGLYNPEFYESFPSQTEGGYIFSPDDLMNFAVALIEATHLERAAREFWLDG